MNKTNRNNGIQYKETTIPVLTITDPTNITGPKYGTVEIPVTIAISAFPFDGRTKPVSNKKQGRIKQTRSKQGIFKQGTNAAQKTEKPLYSERMSTECPYHFFVTTQAPVKLRNKRLDKVRANFIKGKRHGKHKLQDYFAQWSNCTPKTLQETEWLAWIDYLERVLANYEETPEAIAKDFIRNGIGLTPLTNEEIQQIRLNFLLSEANTSVR